VKIKGMKQKKVKRIGNIGGTKPYGFGKYQKQKQNSETLHGIDCYLLIAKRAVFIFKVTLLGLLEREDGCTILPRNVDFFPQTTRPNIRVQQDLHQHTADRSSKVSRTRVRRRKV